MPPNVPAHSCPTSGAHDRETLISHSPLQAPASAIPTGKMHDQTDFADANGFEDIQEPGGAQVASGRWNGEQTGSPKEP